MRAAMRRRTDAAIGEETPRDAFLFSSTVMGQAHLSRTLALTEHCRAKGSRRRASMGNDGRTSRGGCGPGSPTFFGLLLAFWELIPLISSIIACRCKLKCAVAERGLGE